MTDCCTPGTGFPSAASMAQLSTNLQLIWQEIYLIQQGILAASSQCQPGGGQFCTVIGGSTPMTFVSGVQTVTVVDGGVGYFRDTPSVRFVPPVGVVPVVDAVATVVTNGSSILSINMVDGGQGYQPVPATLSISSVAGINGELLPLVNASGEIAGINIVNGGSGYTTSDSIVATRAVVPNPAYVDATFAITSVSLTGEILSIAILNSGSGYQNSVTEALIVSSLDPLVPYPLGAGFFSTTTTDSLGVVSGVIISNTGLGYAAYSPYLVITDVGTGAETTVSVTGTAVSSIAVTSSGSNYTTSATGTILNPLTAALPNPPASPAVVTINVNTNTFGTDPHLYWEVWSGTATNTSIQQQLNNVLSYFTQLGYTIKIQSNPLTGSTIEWKVCW